VHKVPLDPASDRVNGGKLRPKLTHDEVAHAAGLSPFHFSRLFQVVGLASHQYLVRCLLRNDQKLLSAAEVRSIADVPAEAGFADQALSVQQFRRAQQNRAHERSRRLLKYPRKPRVSSLGQISVE
jgi:AraC-like DNA-binding protein